MLQRVLDRVSVLSADGGLPPLVVFGLDGTLFDTRPRTLQILMEYADAIRDEDPEVADALEVLEVDRIRHLLSDTLRECALTHPSLVRDVTAFWHERFHSDEYVPLDLPNPGAPEYVHALHEAGGCIVYLTGRDIHGMVVGTVMALRENGCPFGVPGVQLVMKPDLTLGDETYRRQALPRLARTGEVVALFDSEPTICEMAKAMFPDADVGLLDTWDHGVPDPSVGIDHVRDFRLL